MEPKLQIELENLKAAGELAKASALLKDFLYASGVEKAEPEKIAELCHIYIKQSRYNEAHEQANNLEKILKYKSVSFWRILIAAHILAFEAFLSPGRISGYLLALVKKLVSYQTDNCSRYILNEGLLWGVYWQDMRKALKMNIFCVLSAQTENQLIKSTAFLFYTLAFMGYSGLGLRGLRVLIRRCEQQKRTQMICDLLTWVGVAYQMGGYAKECLQVHQRLAAEFPNTEPFYQIISYASQLNMSLSELGPEEVQQAVDRCFSISFALQESRNHIQIYGGKAALLALQGRRAEAESFLERSKAAAQRNLNTLDDLIFHRMAAVAYLNLDLPLLAQSHIQAARERMKKYAFVMWYKHELARLTAISNYQLNKTLKNKWIQAHKFLLQAILIPNLNLFKKTWVLYLQFISQRHLTYWPTEKESLYFKKQIQSSLMSSRNANLEKITSLLTQTILNQDYLAADFMPARGDLRAQLEQVFPEGKIIVAETLNKGLNWVRTNYGLSASFIHNEEGDSIRASCQGGLYYISVQSSSQSHEKLAVGVVLADLGVESHEIVEMALRMLLTLYSAIRMRQKFHEERLLNQRRIAISHVATQVAHDIRSPLSVFEAALHSLDQVPLQQRQVLNLACSRIRHIADDLLLQAKEMRSIQDIDSEPPTFLDSFQITGAISEIVEEKKAGHSHVKFNWQQMGSYEVRGDRSQFQRMISNLLNNSIEAMGSDTPGVVDISIKDYRNRISLYIKDNGRGIPAQVLDHVGTPGFSFGKDQGNGLGVSFAKSKMLEWGGDFNLASREHEGTIVALSFNVAR